MKRYKTNVKNVCSATVLTYHKIVQQLPNNDSIPLSRSTKPTNALTALVHKPSSLRCILTNRWSRIATRSLLGFLVAWPFRFTEVNYFHVTNQIGEKELDYELIIEL